MTEFSRCVQLVLQASSQVLSYAQRYRRDRSLALPQAPTRPALPEGCVWSDNEEDVQVFLASTAHSQRRMRAWWRCGVRPFAFSIDPPWLDGVLEWPKDEECRPPSERRIRKHLASGVHGALNYRIWMSSAGDGPRQRPSRPRRSRPPRVLPSGSPSLLLTVFRQAPDDPYTPPPEQQEVTRQIQEMEGRITSLKRVEDHAIAAEQWDAAAAYRQDRRGLWQELQTLKASLPPPQGLQDKAACQAVTITVGLDEMLPQEQRRWRKRLGSPPRITWLKAFRNSLCKHPQMGRNPIYIDVHTTTEDDITVQVLAYLLQAEMVLWKDSEPWVKYYAASWGQETEGKRWSNDTSTQWCHAMLEFALPQAANALRPALPAQREPGKYSIPQAAKVLGITERQLRYKIEHEEIPGVEKLGRRVSILPEALEHLRRQVMDQARRQQDKTRRAIFSAKAQQAGMKPPAIRQMIHRGPQTPEGTPDWDALEAQLTCQAAKQRPGKVEATVPSHDDLIDAYGARLHKVDPGSDEWITLQDTLRKLQQGEQGVSP